MKYGIGFILSLAILLSLAWCGKATPSQLDIISTETVSYSNVYVVGQEAFSQENIYGLVIGDNIKNISSDVGGILTYLNCQPWDKVNSNTIIAKITPNPDDLSTQNYAIQQSSLQEQLSNLSNIYDITASNFDLQKEILEQQLENNQKLLENANEQKDLNNSDIVIQSDSLGDQINYIENWKDTDLSKLTMNIENVKEQNFNILSDALKKVNETFGITNKERNSAFDQYISSRSPTLRSQVEEEYTDLKIRLDDIKNQSNMDFAEYMIDFADFLKLVAKAISSSDPSTALPFSSATPWANTIDSLYTTFINLSNTIRLNKNNLDALIMSYQSTDNNYDNQINTLNLNKETLDENKWRMSEIQMENQISNLNLAVDSVNNQLQSIDNNKNIQLRNLQNQYLSLKQNYSIISNAIQWEILRAGVNGIIKSKNIIEWNKLSPNTPICQIVGDGGNGLRIQIYSANPIGLWQQVAFYSQNNFLWNGVIQYQLPYKDPATQNFIYETNNGNLSVMDGDRLNIKFQKKLDDGEIWIPIEYISAKLDGNYVKILNWTNVVETIVKIWDINGWYIKILSWLKNGDNIVY